MWRQEKGRIAELEKGLKIKLSKKNHRNQKSDTFTQQTLSFIYFRK